MCACAPNMMGASRALNEPFFTFALSLQSAVQGKQGKCLGFDVPIYLSLFSDHNLKKPQNFKESILPEGLSAMVSYVKKT